MGDSSNQTSLSSDGTAGYGTLNEPEPYRVFTERDAPDRIRYKWKVLWGGREGFSRRTTEAVRHRIRARRLPSSYPVTLFTRKIAQIQMDEIATFSVTKMCVADEMTRTLIRLPGISERSHVADCTACVGGNTVSFARRFDRVTSIELDPRRCAMLQNNIRVCENEVRGYRRGRYFARVDVRRGDCTRVCLDLPRQDILFFDPPWGGKAYKEKDKIPLYLGGILLDDIARALGHVCTYVAMKLPLNADVRRTLEDRSARVVLDRKFKKMWLLVVRYEHCATKDRPFSESRRLAADAMRELRSRRRETTTIEDVSPDSSHDSSHKRVDRPRDDASSRVASENKKCNASESKKRRRRDGQKA